MELIFHEMKERSLLSPSEQPYYLPQSPIPLLPPPQNLNSDSFNLNNKVSPSILLIIIILAIIFIVSGLLHLLVRFLMRPPNREPEDIDNVTALQGQLQQLFHLHDAGVDQSFIDTLPVFHYKAIIGVKNPFDCAVCLATLLPDFSLNNTCSPIVLVLESGTESSREIVNDREGVLGCEIVENDDVKNETVVDSGEKVVPVRLGKFRNVDGGGGEGSNNGNVDDRRCFSMGSFAYVMDENSLLQVPIRTPMKKPSRKKKTSLPLTPGHRPVISEYDFDSRRFEITSSSSDNNGKAIGKSKKESFSISKIWLRGKKEKLNLTEGSSSRRTFSFRLPEHHHVGAANGGEVDSGRWGNGVNELGLEEENQSRYSLDSEAKTPSFARRTLLWLAGRQNKVVHSSFTPNI
ncbi:putative RING-H2 finger protein ATL50 [Hibiscus syriacus]|uniref:RING-type E3 ubiquitin transferase n=1 Tax=Hibiscus syriacus TaxID=106335 RepID=A0A6A3B4S4_HIBSY|nr:putative RING-H2 finger protein ATL50 [Hibiscus syriacus]